MQNTPTTQTKLQALRQHMAAQNIDAVLVPSSDPHLSEYLPEYWQGRQWLSGFTGSVGTLIVTHAEAGLWVDSRYWVQAEAQLAGSGITLMKIPAANSAAHLDWLEKHLPSGSTLAADGNVLGFGAAYALKLALARQGNLCILNRDPLSEVWADRPSLPRTPVFEHLPPFATSTRQQKLGRVRAEMGTVGADWHLLSTLDDIAWCFNLRGNDVAYNPFFIAHALIGQDSATLFVDEEKFDASLRQRLQNENILLAPYAALSQSLATLPVDSTLLIDPKRVTAGVVEAVSSAVRKIEAINPSVFLKSQKSAEEIAHWRSTMAQDGAALAEFFSALEDDLAAGNPVTELDIDTRVTAARARRPHYVSASFGTIAGFNANGAMPHYRATPESHATISGNGLLLIDSGGQYLGGTTDITRVIAVGEVTDAQKRDFTTVLKGMIALSRARFPRGTRSGHLDTLARAPIWSAGIDYGHGTGHGVGYFLAVHEGPQSISPFAQPEPQTAMEPGMVTSNEPGIYRAGQWGVRLENLLLTVPVVAQDPSNECFGEFLAFETLTLCPIDTRCIAKELLDAAECHWLNDYHAEVACRVGPLVSGRAADWLVRATQAM